MKSKTIKSRQDLLDLLKQVQAEMMKEVVIKLDLSLPLSMDGKEVAELESQFWVKNIDILHQLEFGRKLIRRSAHPHGMNCSNSLEAAFSE